MFQGSMVALVTPMHADGTIDKAAWQRLVDFQLQQGTTAIIVAGSTGECCTLTLAEQHELIKITVKQLAGKIPVIAGTGTYCTASTIERTKAAMELGVDACLLTTPYYNRPTQEGLFLHYQAIAKAVPIPLILYNVPARTSCDLLPETVVRLAAFSNIIGIKEATGNLDRFAELYDMLQNKMDIYSGNDPNCCDLMLQGGKGVISITTNIAPAQMYAMAQAALQGNEQLARSLDAKLQSLHNVQGLEVNPIPIKWMMQRLGLIEAGMRLPLTPLSSQYEEAVLAAMHQAGLQVK